MADNKNNPRSRQNDENEEFPGYPHYPSNEDIMNPNSEAERVRVDVENLTPMDKLARPAHQQQSQVAPPEENPITMNDDDDEVKIVPGTEADVTREDLRVLNSMEETFRTTDSQELDIPGADLDDENEEIGEEDEENNYYSLGGDNHENLEEDPTASGY